MKKEAKSNFVERRMPFSPITGNSCGLYKCVCVCVCVEGVCASVPNGNGVKWRICKQRPHGFMCFYPGIIDG